MRDLLRAFVLLSLAVPACAFSGASGPARAGLQEGDIIFIRSMSSQAPAIEEVMGSSWTHVGIAVKRGAGWVVAEAAGTVSFTPLAKFLDKSRDRAYVVKRYTGWGPRPAKKNILALKKWLSAAVGRPYNIYFEWSDEALYCSEYVWKAYNALPTHPVLSRPRKFSDMKLDGPLARALIDIRYKPAGKKLNMGELVVTPVALLNSILLRTVSVVL